MHRKVLVLLYRTAPAFEVLLLKRVKADKGDWHPVTGNVEPHEQVRAAAAREVEEETGCSVEPEPLGVTYAYDVTEGRRRGRYHETCYSAKLAPDDTIELSEEHTASEWVSPDAARERLAFEGQQRALEALVRIKGRP